MDEIDTRIEYFQQEFEGAPRTGLSYRQRSYVKYNSSAHDLGFHASLDGQDLRTLEIVNPAGPIVPSEVSDDSVVIHWEEATSTLHGGPP